MGDSSHEIPVHFHGGVATQIPLKLAHLGTYGYLELATRELQTVPVHVEYDGDVGGNGPLFGRMIQRIVLARLHDLSSVPVSHGFEMEMTTGWAITNHAIRIIDGPSPADPGNVTIALNTWPNRGRGIPTGLNDWVNPGFEFGVCYDERFLVQAVAQALADDRIPKEYDECGCPKVGGPVRVQDIAINLAEGCITLFVTATYNGGNFVLGGGWCWTLDQGTLCDWQ